MGAPVGYTCSTIDDISNSINEALKSYNDCHSHVEDLQGSQLSPYQENVLDKLYDSLKDIEHYLWGLEDTLEEVRDANSKLRDWGDELESELEDLRDEF